jgi:ubiquinone/menaquinone biosynthesis C-methylase UbiE
MAIVRIDNYIDAYRLRTQSADRHEMAGRGNKTALTRFVNSWILEEIKLAPDDVLIDIGCGDGCLLKMAEGQVANRIGVVPTQEEQQALKEIVPGVSIVTGLVQKLPLPANTASKIVCNAVFMYLQSVENVILAFTEIARVAKPGAQIWIGEVPESDDYARYRQYHGDSIPGLLRHVLNNDGPRAMAGMIRKILRSTIGRERIVLNSAGLFCATPEQFLKLSESSTLRLEKYFRHRELDQTGNVVESPFRYNYIFLKS